MLSTIWVLPNRCTNVFLCSGLIQKLLDLILGKVLFQFQQMRYAMIVTFQGINWETEFLIRVIVTYPSPHPTFCS